MVKKKNAYPTSKKPPPLKAKYDSKNPLFYLKVTLFLIILSLVKIGQIPLYIPKLFTLISNSISKKAKQLFKIFHSNHKKRSKKPPIEFRSSFSLLSLFKPKHKRGRPRQKAFFPFYYQKTIKALKRSVPKKKRFRIAFLALLVAIIGYSLFLSKVMANLPSPHQLTTTERPLTTQILDRNGKMLYQIYEGRNRTIINLEDLPPYLVNATIAIEDKNFFKHHGIDFRGVIRAVKANLTTEQVQGGSTITQQLIKNTLLTSDKTLKRKIKEALLAFWAERVYSKKEILQMYFNEAPYGGPAWGVEAASEMYFGKQAKDLDLAESSYLAGLPVAPTEYSPYGTHPEKGKERQKEVLNRMIEDNYISQDEADQAYSKQLAFNPPRQEIKAPHFVMYVRSLLAQKYGERTVSQGGLKVVTSLDLDLQEKAENIVSGQIEKLSELNIGNGAAMVLDTKTGQILAMVGSKNYFDPSGGNFNVALALRQPGSSIKPITYLTAFKQGFSPGTVLLDTPTTFPNPWGQAYSPVNYDGAFHGAVTIRTALGSSYNIPAVKTLAMVGLPAMLETAKEMGITTFETPENYGLSLTLGGGAVRMIDMMSAYNVLASGGLKYEPQSILSVTDTYGDVLEDNSQPLGKRVVSEGLAYLITNILSDNKARAPAFGTNSLLEIPNHTIAVKTGTSDDKRDNWTFGFTPENVVGVWVGNNDYSPMDPRLTSGITGATPIWHDIMLALTENKPDIAFSRPTEVTEVTVDGHKDLGVMGVPTKSALSYRRNTERDKITGAEKEAITYSDAFTTFTLDQTKTTQ